MSEVTFFRRVIGLLFTAFLVAEAVCPPWALYQSLTLRGEPFGPVSKNSTRAGEWNPPINPPNYRAHSTMAKLGHSGRWAFRGWPTGNGDEVFYSSGGALLPAKIDSEMIADIDGERLAIEILFGVLAAAFLWKLVDYFAAAYPYRPPLLPPAPPTGGNIAPPAAPGPV